MREPGAATGTYVLLLALSRPVRLTVGRLGTFDFEPGHYAYAGSACGPGGLQARLAHHLRPTRNPHWHIDYLRNFFVLREIWFRRSAKDEEHLWFDRLRAMRGARIPVSGFGSSDCRCQAHLVYFRNRPSQTAFRRRLPASPEVPRRRIHRLQLPAGGRSRQTC